MRSIVRYSDVAVESKRLLSTYFMGLTKRNKAPQKVRPRPMNARVCDSRIIETMSEEVPVIMNMALILSGWNHFDCLDVKFSTSSCGSSVACAWNCAGAILSNSSLVF